jgi:predicted RNase H-like nuclease
VSEAVVSEAVVSEAVVSEAVVGGLDGCRAGWVLATVPLDAECSIGAASASVSVQMVPDLRPVVADIAAGRIAAVGIDIPIGLADRDPRPCDREARRMLGARRSSVFPAPARGVLGATTYATACELSRRVCGKAISKQLFNILPKISEVDDLVSPGLQAHVFEMCPELSFTLLSGSPMRSTKRTAEGRAERIAALRPAFGDVTPFVEHPPPGAAADDVLDAIVGAWTAGRYRAGVHTQLGGERDRRGLRMEVIV